MARYPIKLLKDKDLRPFFPFNTLESVLVNNTNMNLKQVLDGIYTKNETNNAIGTAVANKITKDVDNLTYYTKTSSLKALAFKDKVDYNQEVLNKPNLKALAFKDKVDYDTEILNKPNLNTKQDTLVSGVNIKTINDQSILGSGNIVIQGGGGGTSNYNDLSNKPSVNGVTLLGDLSLEDLGIIIPTKVSDLTNDSDYATREFVNSSIATQTSYFQGTFEDVEDLPTTDVTPNDYAFVVVYDPVITTQVKQYDRYKYDGEEWVFEYTLNNSSFTAAQWAAINSGIDDTKVATIANNVTRLNAIDTEIAGINSDIGDIEDSIEDIEDTVTAHTTSISTLNTDLATTNTNVTNLSSTVSGHTTDISDLSTRMGQAENDIDAIDSAKQDTLVSGTNIKTINNTSILGSGDITIEGSKDYEELENQPSINGNTLIGDQDASDLGLDTMTNFTITGTLTLNNIALSVTEVSSW